MDIDNTLYDYNYAHGISKKSVIEFCCDKFLIDKENIENAYSQARSKVHEMLFDTAASHNRLLYFQSMCEILKLNPLENGLDFYNIYWNTFLNNINPFEGVYDLFKKYNKNICLITDLTAHIQYKKVEKLNLSDFCNNIVTSEEVGKEKPNPEMFLLAIQKLNLKENEVCMIGDNFYKDILGASKLGIKSIWLNHEFKKENYSNKIITEVNRFNEILNII